MADKARNGAPGARNSAARTSQFLSLMQCQGLIASAEHAERIGLHFNRQWTIHYERAGIGEHEATRFIGRLLKLASDCARRHKSKVAAMWVRENGDGKGGHVHILLHLPRSITLRNLTFRWIKTAGGQPVRRVSKVRTIGGMWAIVDVGGARYRTNADAVLTYLLKAAGDETGKALALHRCCEGGPSVGKRAGWTQNIGLAARSSFGQGLTSP